MEKLEYPYILVRREKEFTWYKRNALKVLWAKAKHNNSILHFENGEVLISSLTLKEFHPYVWKSGLFRRWHHSYLLRRDAIKDCCWLFAIMNNGEQVPVNRKGYHKTKS